MKPVLVLLLVLAAAGGFFFVLGKDKAAPAGNGAPISGPADTDEDPIVPDTGGTELEGPDRGGQREDAGPTDVTPDPPVEVSAAPQGNGTVTGQVIDGNGDPVQDAEVRLSRNGGQAIFLDPNAARIPDLETKSLADGTFTFTKVDTYDLYTVIVEHRKFKRAELHPIEVVLGEAVDVGQITMTEGATLTGRITDSGGNIVAGANVTLRLNTIASFTEEGADASSTQSDSNGRYRFENAEGNYTLRVEAEGYGRVEKQNVNVSGLEEIELDVVIEVAHMIAGTVRSRDGEPLEDVTIQAWSMMNRQNQSRSRTRSEAQGEFLIADVPQGTYRLMAEHDGYRMADTSLRADTGDMSLQIIMEPLPKIRGRVVAASSGQPITSFTVQLRRRIPNAQATVAVPQSKGTFSASPDGSFELPVPQEGEYRVLAKAGGFADTLSDPFPVSRTGDVSGVTVRMIEGGKIRGRVVDASGAPVSGARVTSHQNEFVDDLFARSLGDLQPWLATETSATTGSDGTYELDSLMPETYKLIIKHPDYADAEVAGILVTDGSTAQARDVQLPRGGSISGTVFGPTGAPLAGATVRLLPQSTLGGSAPGNYTARADAQGRYEVRNVKQGTYKAWATMPRTAGASPFQEGIDMKFTERILTVRDADEITGEDFKLQDQ